MSFREPLLLLGLLLIPLAVLAYLRAQRRRRRYAVRYTNVDVLAKVAGRSWGRHVPAALALLALAVLLIGLGRPERTVAATQRQGTVVMVTDTSGSMQTDDVPPSRLAAAQGAARALSKKLPAEFRLGLVTFNSVAEQQVAPTTDRGLIDAAVANLRVHGATAMGDGLQLGLRSARVPITDANGRPQRLPAALVLLSDGKSTRGVADPVDVADEAKKLKIPVYAIALGTQSGVLTRNGHSERVPPDLVTLRDIAETTRGRFFVAPSAARLATIYENLGAKFSTRRVKQEVTSAFAGGALVLLLAGGVLSLLRTGRLP